MAISDQRPDDPPPPPPPTEPPPQLQPPAPPAQGGLPPNLTAPNISPTQPQGDPNSYLNPPPEWIAAEQARREATAPTERALQSGIDYRKYLLQHPIQAPPDPRLQNIPQAPQLQYRDAFQAFQSPAILLATLGSMFTRRAAVNALTAGAEAMNGFMAGDKERVERGEKNWLNAVKQTEEQNKVELERYGAAWKRTNLSVSERVAQMEGIAASVKDETMLGAIRSGSAERVQQFIDARVKGQEQLEHARVIAESRNQLHQSGLMGKQSSADDIVEGIISGRQPPTLTGLYGTSPLVRAGLEKKGFNLGKATLEWEAAKKQVAQLNSPQMTRLIQLNDTMKNTIPEVRGLADQMQLSGVRWANIAELQYYTQVKGNTPEGQLASRYLTAVLGLREEFAQAIRGGYAPTEEAFKLATQQINENAGDKQINASLTEIERLINYRMTAIANRSTYGPGAPNQYLGTGGQQPAQPQAPTATPPQQGQGWGPITVR